MMKTPKKISRLCLFLSIIFIYEDLSFNGSSVIFRFVSSGLLLGWYLISLFTED